MAAQDTGTGPREQEAAKEKKERDLGIPPLPPLDWSDGGMERQWREGVKAEAPRGATSKPGEP